MPKFGQDLFNGARFGKYDKQIYNTKVTIRGVPLGFSIRKQFKKQIIFRVRPGNGHHGATLGVRYQDKYKYFVPSTINHPNGQPARNALIQAMTNWYNLLTDEQRADYNKRAARNNLPFGYNLYVKDFIKANV